MSTQDHFINNHAIELTVSSSENVMKIRQRFEQILKEEVFPQLEPILDRLAGPDEWLELDELDVDLGVLNPREPDNAAWIEKAVLRYRKAFDEQVRTSRIKKKDKKTKILELLRFFLRYGSYPWWARNIDLEKVLQKQKPFMANEIISLLADDNTRIRWISQFSNETQEILYRAINGGRTPEISIKQLSVNFPDIPVTFLKKIYWETLWETSIRKPHDSSTIWLDLLFQKILVNPTQEGVTERLIEDPVLKQLKKHTERPFETVRIKSQQEKIVAPLSGIVIIHPFLPAFFERIKLVVDGQFTGEKSQERAIHCLYFLATGLQYPAEQETVLLKILCGLDQEYPIEKELELTENERGETTLLLEEIIYHWGVLAGTSPDELRGSFFMRDGLLHKVDSEWRLKVEGKSYDVLLNNLPWGISPIMHSWMKEMVWVEWG